MEMHASNTLSFNTLFYEELKFIWVPTTTLGMSPTK